MGDRRRLCGPGEGYYEEKKSRFLAEIHPIRDDDEARAKLEAARRRYPDARHHCQATVLPDGSVRRSDDGEPGGTAGAPMADVLVSAGVTGATVIVTRYFGGTLLGSGGLVRAYSKAAQAALSDAGTEPDPQMMEIRFHCPWSALDRAHRLLRQCGCAAPEEDEADAQGVRLCAVLAETERDGFLSRLSDATGGRAAVEEIRLL